MLKALISATVLFVSVSASADVFVETVPNPIGAHEMRKAIKAGKTGYKCIKSKVSKKTGNVKSVKKAKPVFTVSTLKSLENADERFDNNEKLFVCNAMTVDEDTNKLVKDGDED